MQDFSLLNILNMMLVIFFVRKMDSMEPNKEFVLQILPLNATN